MPAYGGRIPERQREPVRRAWLSVIGLMPLAGSDGVQSALNPHGPFADRLALMSWIVFAVAAVIFLVTMGFLWHAVRGFRGHRPRLSETCPTPRRIQRPDSE
jgi:hypothetical protein